MSGGFVKFRVYAGREWRGGFYINLWLWGGRGIKIKPRHAMLFSDRYVSPMLGIGRYVIVFAGFGRRAQKGTG